MYRQILVDPNQRDLQRIMWKTSVVASVKTYKLATVTFGTVSAPFLATRTLKALANEEKAEFPDGAEDAPVKTLEIARLYDPLGLIGPIVTKAKIFIQELRKIKLDWSEQLPPDAMEEWKNFYQKLSKVNNFKIPRCILLPATIRIEIHGFSDASERAYAAVVNIKCFNESGQSRTRLLCSKSRVAPLKTLTIPKLELSAALLLSRLVKKVVPILQLPINKIWMWTDSTSALAWTKTEPHKLKTFVSNRVVDIQTLSKDCHWKHVSSKINPADLISRGCNVDELLKNEMWFSGPDLQTDEYEDNQLFPDPSYRDELKCAVTLSITEYEVKRSTEFLAKIAQLSEFKAEIDALKKGKGVSKTIPLSDNINEYEVLTPIIGRPISAIPEPAILDISDNRLSRWQYTTKCVQTIWKRWKNDYLNHLRQRNKWQFEKNNVAVGCLVLLKENDLPPCKWAMARILEVFMELTVRSGHGSLLVKVSVSWLACHEFEPNAAKDLPFTDERVFFSGKSFVVKNLGPFHHKELLRRLDGSRPLETRSSGFCSEET
ncbi:integrase catalytic domain-containing protein [Trichonephila clavipes]|nr:integrase catalytic domain-containing protein [Trichonephila clavipes]